MNINCFIFIFTDADDILLSTWIKSNQNEKFQWKSHLDEHFYCLVAFKINSSNVSNFFYFFEMVYLPGVYADPYDKIIVKTFLPKKESNKTKSNQR